MNLDDLKSLGPSPVRHLAAFPEFSKPAPIPFRPSDFGLPSDFGFRTSDFSPPLFPRTLT